MPATLPIAPGQRVQRVISLLRKEDTHEAEVATALLAPWRDEVVKADKYAPGSGKVTQNQFGRQVGKLLPDLREQNQIIGELTVANRKRPKCLRRLDAKRGEVLGDCQMEFLWVLLRVISPWPLRFFVWISPSLSLLDSRPCRENYRQGLILRLRLAYLVSTFANANRWACGRRSP